MFGDRLAIGGIWRKQTYQVTNLRPRSRGHQYMVGRTKPRCPRGAYQISLSSFWSLKIRSFGECYVFDSSNFHGFIQISKSDVLKICKIVTNFQGDLMRINSIQVMHLKGIQEIGLRYLFNKLTLVHMALEGSGVNIDLQLASL